MATHRLEDQPPVESGFHFVTGLDHALDRALDRALDLAVEAAGEADVSLGGGVDLIRQGLASAAVDELVISTAPVILGGGKRLFDGFEEDIDLEVLKVVGSPHPTHVRYRVGR